MRAAVQKAIHRVEVEDVPEPAIQPDQIKVKIAFAGVCGTDILESAQEVTGGLGFDAVIDCTGKLAGAEQAVRLAGPGGHVVWAAVYPVGKTVPVEAWTVFEKDLSIHGVFQSPYYLQRANRMLSVLDLKPLISHVYSLEDINQAFEDQRNGKVMKALVKPQRGRPQTG